MKIIHCADVHLGSRMNNLPSGKAEDRAREVRAALERLIGYAGREGIKHIVLAGDIFDSDRPFKKDKEFFYSAVRRNADITFYYLRGNHDGKESYTEQIENLKTFGEEWTAYSAGENVVLYGLEITAGNCVSMYSSLKTNPADINIVVLHGQAGEVAGECRVNINKLKNKNIDYLALGHVHAFKSEKLDARGAWAYSGCLEGRGFDETGEKGFIVYDTKERSVCFVPFACRTVEERDIDISGAQDAYAAVKKIKSEISINKNNLLRLNLTGELKYFDETLAADIERYIADICYFVTVRDDTRIKADYSALKDSLSLKGEFVRLAFAEELDESDRQKIIDMGIKALSGQVE